VTAERGLEAQLLQAQKLEAIGRLSGGMAHDFNNILSVVTGATALLGELLRENSLVSEDIELIYEAVARGASLTRDLLAFSRRQVVKPTVTDVRTVICEAERMVNRLVGNDIEVETDIGNDGLNVLIDASQLSQVLINLAINARDAMGAGGKLCMDAASVTLDSSGQSEALLMPPGAYALIAVSDTGMGMTADVLARAFEPFFTTKPAGSGSGLGLSVCYGIIRQAGGSIGIDSELGRGTTVKIYLPLTEERREPVAANHGAPPVGVEATPVVAKS
jgi:signal transduction histidine kinase